MTTHQDGVYQYGGAPVGSNRYSSPWATHWFVDAVDGNNGDGKSLDQSMTAIDTAVQQMGVGDVLYIRPQTYVVGTGHARYQEIVTVDLAQSDLSIIGASYPQNNEFKVRMRTATTGYGFTIAGPSCHIENIGMITGGSGTGNFQFQNNGGTNTQRGSDGPTLYNCHFKEGTDIMTGGQSPGFFNCRFHYTTGKLAIASGAVSSYGLRIVGCDFLDNNGAVQTGPYITSGGGHCYNLKIHDCTFGRKPTNHYMNFAGTLSTGMISHCYFNAATTVATDFVGLGNHANLDLVGCWDNTVNLINS